MPTSPFSRTAVAGENTAHYFTTTLLDVSTYVGILPPTFKGTLLSNEHGLEAWHIETLIPGREEDPVDEPMKYGDDYPDWDYSIDVAMQGAIARICHKYHHRIARTSAYHQFGERTEDGEAVFRNDSEMRTLIHRYEVEREFSASGMEQLMRVQLHNIDHLKDILQDKNEVIAKTQDLVESLDGERLALLKRISFLEDPLKMEEKLISSDIWAEVMTKTLQLTLENRTAEAKRREAEIEALKLENESLKKTITELTSVEESSRPRRRMRASQCYQQFQSGPSAS